LACAHVFDLGHGRQVAKVFWFFFSKKNILLSFFVAGAPPLLRALIFDVDGTLAETEELHREAFNETFAAAGLDWHWDQPLYAELLSVTGGKERMAHFQLRAGITPKLPPDRIASLHADKTARYTARVNAGGVALRPGIRRLLTEATRAGLKLAIATTTSRPNVEALLAAAAPLPPFDVIAAGDEVRAKKPAPDVFLLALAGLGLPAHACLAFEDTLNGLRSARGAGLRTVVTISAYGGTGPFQEACAVVTHLGDDGAPAAVLAGPALPDGVADLAWLERLPV
jgi:HAD superfamily hydrolase (TIGR01509 family)